MPSISGVPEKIKRMRQPEALPRPESSSRQSKIEKGVEIKTVPAEIVEATDVEVQKVTAPPAKIVAPQPVASVKNPELVAVEKILEENVSELYAELPPNKKAAFRREGERVAQVVWLMLKTAKVQVQKIVELIRNWLKIIPGINRYFLEQESKIKTDKIIELARQKKGE